MADRSLNHDAPKSILRREGVKRPCAAEGLGQDLGAVQRQVDKAAVGAEAAVGAQGVHVRLPVEQRAVRLDAEDDADLELGLAQGGVDEVGGGGGRDPGRVAQELSAPAEVGAQALGQAEDELAVRDGGEDLRVQPGRPLGHAPRVAAGAEVARLTAEGQQVLGAAVLAAHAGDPHGIVKGLAHITGGGLVDNLPRVLPKDCDAVIDTSSWKTPAIFEHIERCSGVVQLRH